MTATAEELRAFPAKASWTPEESLALLEVLPGSSQEAINGAPLPDYVRTREDKVRWANCVRIACQMTEEPATVALAGQFARTMFTNREEFPD